MLLLWSSYIEEVAVTPPEPVVVPIGGTLGDLWGGFEMAFAEEPDDEDVLIAWHVSMEDLL